MKTKYEEIYSVWTDDEILLGWEEEIEFYPEVFPLTIWGEVSQKLSWVRGTLSQMINLYNDEEILLYGI